MITSFGWRTAFLVLAIVGLIWAGYWFLIGKEGPYTSRAAEHALDEHGTGYLSDDGYEVRELDGDEDGAFSVLVAQVVEVSL